MSTSPTVYVNGDFSEPMTAQHNFQSKYDLDNPLEAMTTYARVMHQHTKSQMDIATRSARRRSPNNAVNTMSSLSTEASVDSQTSS
ncbi:hypothetical protein LPUS_07828 [Lasallia pustulata]|nr:hypothetical protein LPUS_07828 [Lasallia pustulata]